MIQFEKNDIPRRKQFWTKVLNCWPVAYSSSTSLFAGLYQFGIVSDYTFSQTSLLSLYVWGSVLLSIAGASTVAQTYRPDFNIWWTESPRYEPLEEFEVDGEVNGEVNGMMDSVFDNF